MTDFEDISGHAPHKPKPEHQVEIHEHPLNDGTAWYQVTCSCGWVHEDPTVENPALRIRSQETAAVVRDKHLEEAG